MKQLLLWIKQEHPDVLKRTVAAYLLGFRVPQDYLDQVGLPFATGSTDTVVTTAPLKAGSPWPNGVLHRWDMDIFYYDLQKNVRDRITAYEKK